MSKYLDKFFREFKMDQSKKEFLCVLHVVKLSKTQSPTTVEDRKRMKVLPYSIVISSIKYVVYQTYCVPCHEFGKGVQ